MQYIVNPYINTFGTNKFKEFLLKPFTFDNIPELFYGWKRKKMVNWVKFTSEECQLDILPYEYEIQNKKTNKKHKIPHPKTINDFINDMCRFDIPLIWDVWIENEFKPKDYLKEKQIVEYYRELLKKLNKEHELLIGERESDE